MMRFQLIVISLLGLFAVTAWGGAGDNPVAISGTKGGGHAVAFSDGNECFALTAYHVVKAPGTYVATGKWGKDSFAKFTKKFSDDLALLRIEDEALCNPEKQCQVDDLGAVLSGATQGILRARSKDGGITQIDVGLTYLGDPHLEIEATSSGALTEGLSGAVLVVGGQPVGILLSVETRKTTGKTIGKIHRIDRAWEFVQIYVPSCSKTHLPDIAGLWQTNSPLLVYIFTQNGDQITWSIPSGPAGPGYIKGMHVYPIVDGVAVEFIVEEDSQGRATKLTTTDPKYKDLVIFR